MQMGLLFAATAIATTIGMDCMAAIPVAVAVAIVVLF